MDIIKYKKVYFAISLLVMVPGIIALALWGLNLSIDFTGGSRTTLSFTKFLTQKEEKLIKDKFEGEKIKINSIEKAGTSITLRTSPVDEKQNAKILEEIKKENPQVKQDVFETVGPTIGKETTVNAFKAVLISALLVVVYISWVFRKVPKPASSIRFGVSTILALIHDVLVVVGVFAILGHFLNVEVDSLFITALLTVIGFSVHDTIVVFDRIRENLARRGAYSFAQVVNDSTLQTLNRSLNTSITILLVLIALLIFGGESIRWFVVALTVGLVSGTYSSIFTASPILVVWHEWSQRRKTRS